MHKPLLALLSPLIATFAFAAEDSGASPGAQTTRPPGYKSIAGDAKLGVKRWKDTKLFTNGMSCNACHANHGAFQASFAQPYPHTVQMAKKPTRSQDGPSGRNDSSLPSRHPLRQRVLAVPLRSTFRGLRSKSLAANFHSAD